MLIQHFVKLVNDEIVIQIRQIVMSQNDHFPVDEVDVVDQTVVHVLGQVVQMDEDTVVTEFFSLVKNVTYQVLLGVDNAEKEIISVILSNVRLRVLQSLETTLSLISG